ncbi:MAG: Holliday junction branch migration protein RuvA [Clostridia bacterium]|nr:Holliday junction branch migration protein RuvA [Clostridia bacterium]MDD4386200.1 Holliday junction branch migration protein RuvA [Clostridia bacterium]
MYAYFNGLVKDISNDKVIIDVNNIGYDIHMAEDDLNKLKLDDKVLIYTFFQHREDEMKLFGFLTKNRLQFFKKLISVSGVGSKVALGIISNISIEDMCTAIATDNILTLKSVPGIGPKLAAKIIFELKDKISNVEILKKSTVKNNIEVDEAITALKVLGYSERELSSCVNEMNLENKSVQDIIRMCLKYLQK